MDTMTYLAGGACPTIATDVFTATAKTSVLEIDISNPTGAPQLVILQFAGAILFSVNLPSNGGASWHGPQVLNAGSKINIQCASALCGYTISGVVIT